jgi:hypothetical protein
MGPGFLLAALGMLLLTQLEIGSSYAGLLLPAQLLLGLGIGAAFMPARSLSTHGVQPRDAGVASAMVNTSQQVGGAIGTALLKHHRRLGDNAYISDHLASAAFRLQQQLVQLQGMAHGYTNAFWYAAGILVASAAIALTTINTSRSSAPADAGSGTSDATENEELIPVVAH